MPIDLRPRQVEALRVLDWLFSDQERDRRDGRSYVLAFAYLRKAAMGLDQWVYPRDHHGGTRGGDRLILDSIRAVAYDLNIFINMDYSQYRFRIREEFDSSPHTIGQLFPLFLSQQVNSESEPELSLKEIDEEWDSLDLWERLT